MIAQLATVGMIGAGGTFVATALRYELGAPWLIVTLLTVTSVVGGVTVSAALSYVAGLTMIQSLVVLFGALFVATLVYAAAN